MFYYSREKFNQEQINAIELAIGAGLNPEKWAKPEYDSMQMFYCYHAQKLGLDLTSYIKDFSIDQIMVIFTGLRMGLDVSQYATPNLPSDEMAKQNLILLRNRRVNFCNV
jgi:hypothetical protein